MIHGCIKKLATTVLSVLVITLSACGFHLRGQNTLPTNLRCIKLESLTPYGDLESTLRRNLTLLGVRVTRTDNAPVTLKILNSVLYTDVPTIGGSNQARVYVYYYQVNFQLLDTCHHTLIPPRTVTTSGTLIVNAGTALESTNQLEVLTQELQVEATQMIINILNSPQVACATNHI